MEIWKDIKGYEGRYQVSNSGRIKSLPRIVDGIRKTPGRILAPSPIGKGYLQVYLYKHGKVKAKLISRLVAKAFVPNPFNKPEVNHIDEIKSNCCASNLEWVTHQENIDHSRSAFLFSVAQKVLY